jgi:hypothetical protein
LLTGLNAYSLPEECGSTTFQYSACDVRYSNNSQLQIKAFAFCT